MEPSAIWMMWSMMDEDERRNGKRLTNDRHTGIIGITSTHHYCVAVK